MTTRSRTRSTAKGAAVTAPTSMARGKPKSKKKEKEQEKVQLQEFVGVEIVSHNTGKENEHAGKLGSAKLSVNAKAGGKKGKKERDVMKPVDCFCSKGDDGSPMIYCQDCRIWYHFTCVDVTEPEAEEISVYVCPTCTESTGRRSASEFASVAFLSLCTLCSSWEKSLLYSFPPLSRLVLSRLVSRYRIPACSSIAYLRARPSRTLR
ncbi:hypothetical protein B0H34DRAFT_404517 [Crassisporium funariophilum]|nr:hypothetical protein B0H34DRAFT_404517 [Crassisporium funariophilum]